MKEKVKRYVVFIVGLFISSFGVSFITKADLGTSPISSIPYTMSLRFKPTLGEFTIIFSLILIVLQLLILKKDFKKEYWLQIPVSIAFGYFIDFTMILLNWLVPETYIMKVVALLIGCVILGLGVFFEVIANVVMLPGESFVRAINFKYNKDFGITKVVFDASMTIIAGISSIIMFKDLVGVREGTIIAALLVGIIAKFFSKYFGFIEERLFDSNTEEEEVCA